MKLESQLQVSTSSGVAPFTVNQATLVSNLNAQYLNGQLGGYYQNAGNLNVGTLLAARLPAFTGDVSSTVGTVGLTLASVGTAGTYRSVTTDAKGRVTAGTNPTTLAGYGITDAIDISGAAQTKSGNLTVSSALTSGGNFYAATTVQYSNRQQIYTVNYGGAQDLAWKKIADVIVPSGLYRGITFKIDVVDNQGNFGWNSNCFTLTYFASCIRSGGVQDDYNNANVTGPVADYVRVVKTATGVYELQIRQLADWQTYIFTAEATINSGGCTVTYASTTPANGSTSGTIYNATATAAAGWTSKLANIAVAGVSSFAGQITSTIATGTAPLVIASTTLVSNLNAQYLNGQLGSYYAAASSLASYLPLAGGTLTGELVVNYAAGRQRIIDGANALILGHWDTVNVRIEASGRPMYIVSYNGAISIGRSSGSNLVVDTASVSYGGNTVLHAGNYTAYPDATKLPLAGGTLTGNLALNTGVIFNRGSAPSITNIQCSIFNELNGISNAESLNSRAYGGFKWQYWDGSVTWMQLTSAGLTINGNNTLHAGNYNSYALPLTGGTLTGALNGTTASFSTKVLSSRFHDSGDAFLFRSGSGTGATRHLNLADSTGDPSGITAGTGITWGERSDNNPYYLIYPRYSANGSGTYSRLALAWHTGVEIGAAPQFGGTRFFNNSPFTGAEIFSVGNGDSNVRVVNTLYIGGNTALHAGNYTSYPDATKLPLAGGTLTGGLSGTTGYFSSDVTWIGYNSGNPRSARLGYSGGNYGSVSYGINYTATTASHTYAFNDAVTRIDLADGIQVYSAAAAVAGTAVSWTTLLEATRGNGNLRWKGNTVLDSNNYNSFALPLGGGTMTGSIILPAAGYVGLSGGSTFGIGVLATNRNSGVFDTLESTGSDPLELNYYQGGPVKIGSGTYGSKSLYAVGIYDNGNAVLTSASTSAPSLSIGGSAGAVPWSGITSKPTTFGGYGITDLVYGSTGSRNVWTITDWNQGTYPNAHFLSSESSTANAPSSDYTYGLQTSFHRSGAAYRTQMVTELYSSSSIWVRNSRDSDVWTAWSKLLHSNNYSSYALPLSGGTLTGGLTVTNLFGNANSASLYANNGSGYGSWKVGGTRNGWYGIEFESGSNLMMNSNQVGFHRNGYGWQLWWSAGTAYCHKGDPGAGTQATILDSSNVATYALPIGGGALTGTLSIDTSGTAGASTVAIKRSGQGVVGFGSYAGSWRSALQIQSNANDRMLFFVPPEADYQYGVIRSVNGGLKIDVGGTTGNGGGNAISIETSGAVSMPGTLNVVGAVTQNGNQVLHAGNYTSYTLPRGGGWYGASLPGTRWGGFSANGGEIVFGQDLPAAGQMGILIDGCYIAAENNGFWSLANSNDWTTRRGMSFDGTYLRFDYNSATAYFHNASIGGSQVLHAGNYTAYPDATKLPLAGGTLTGQVQLKAGHGDTRFQLYYNYANDTNHAFAGFLTLWSSEPGITHPNGGIGANINMGGQYYGRAGSGNAYGVYLRFDVVYGRTEFYNTTGVPGTAGGQGTLRAKIESDGEIYATASQYKVLHAGNYNSYALPLSGGTLASTNDQILTLNKSSGSGWGYIGFSQAGTRRFYFGLNASFEPELGVDNGGTFRVNGGMTVGGNAVLTTGNYTSYALPLAGGTLTGALNGTTAAFSGAISGTELTLSGVGMGAYNLMKYSGVRSGDWQTFTTTEGQLNVIQVNNITGGGHTNYPTGVYGYGAVMSWRTNSHSFQLYAAHTGDLAYKTQWGNDNYSGWRRILDSTNYPYAAAMNQSVGTSNSPTFASLLITSEISISKNNPRNLLIQGSGGSDSGLLGRGSSGQFAFQLYGSGGGDYGFLDGAWAGWDIRKTVDGNLYLNDNTTYYLNPASTTNLLSLTVANTITGSVSGNAGGSSASCTGNAASSTVSTYVSSLGSNINYEPYNGSRATITKTNGLSHYTGYSGGTNRPTTYDYTLQVANGSMGWEISMDWISLAGPAIFARSLRDCCQGWSAWVRILDSVNYSYAAAMNQNVGTGNSPSFTGLSVINTITGAVSGSSGSCTGNAATATGQQSGVHFALNTGGAGYGLVGQYNPDLHQGLFAMGAAYTLGASGTLANFYGVSWSYDYSGRQLNTGYNLQHCLAIANAGSVYTVIGQGIWTSGLIRANGAISSGGTITAAAFSGPLTGNVTGNLTGLASSATTAGNVNGYSTSTGVGANTIVVRDASGYIYAHYINTNVSESENPTVSSFFTSNGDGWLRKSTVAHVKTTLNLSGTNTGDQTNISGSSGSCTGNAASVTDGVYLSTNQSIGGVKTFSSAPIATNIAKAWVHYNKSTTTITASYNVSSVTSNGTGVFTVNFTNAMVDTNYVVAGTATYGYDDQDIYGMALVVPRRSTAQQAGSCRLATEFLHAAQIYDCVAVRAVFYR